MRAQLSKPWITSAILKSIKKRQKLFTTHFLSNDPNKVKEYKKYNNKLNKIKEAATTNYFKTHFDMFSDNFLSRNTGVISKLRHCLSLKQLTEIYYNLIYPYISCAIVAWDSTSKTNLHKIQAKQNHVIRLMFFATLSGKNTDSALPLLNILEMLMVANVYRLHALKFIHAWHKGVLPEPQFNHFFQYASNVHNYNTRYAAKQNLHKFRVKTNTKI